MDNIFVFARRKKSLNTYSTVNVQQINDVLICKDIGILIIENLKIICSMCYVLIDFVHVLNLYVLVTSMLLNVHGIFSGLVPRHSKFCNIAEFSNIHQGSVAEFWNFLNCFNRFLFV